MVVRELHMNKSVDGSGAPLYVITLLSGVAPMPLEGPSHPKLAGLAVFRSRRREDGRDRFRLHIGYFSSAQLAEEVLPLVRKSHPAAFVTLAPQTNLGSLDDTAIARFKIIRPLESRPRVPERHAAPPLKPQAAPPLRPVAAAAPPATAAAQVPQPPPPAPNGSLQEKVTQHYAVQLLWSEQAIDLSRLPALAIFGGYLLYAVETERKGQRVYGLRLGFYTDALSAGLVAQYVKPKFAGAVVVPVSDREHTRASTAEIGLASIRAWRRTGMRVSWPSSAIPVELVPGTPANSVSY
jgi:hypothetical protein